MIRPESPQTPPAGAAGSNGRGVDPVAGSFFVLVRSRTKLRLDCSDLQYLGHEVIQYITRAHPRLEASRRSQRGDEMTLAVNVNIKSVLDLVCLSSLRALKQRGALYICAFTSRADGLELDGRSARRVRSLKACTSMKFAGSAFTKPSLPPAVEHIVARMRASRAPRVRHL